MPRCIYGHETLGTIFDEKDEEDGEFVGGKELSIHMRTLPIVWGLHLVRTSCGIGITDIDTLGESLWYDL